MIVTVNGTILDRATDRRAGKADHRRVATSSMDPGTVVGRKIAGCRRLRRIVTATATVTGCRHPRRDMIVTVNGTSLDRATDRRAGKVDRGRVATSSMGRDGIVGQRIVRCPRARRAMPIGKASVTAAGRIADRRLGGMGLRPSVRTPTDRDGIVGRMTVRPRRRTET